MKRIILYVFTILLVGLVFNLGIPEIESTTTPVLLENGNWDLGYTPNDTTSYYATLEGLKGEEFIDELNQIISTGLTYYKYGRSSNQTAYHLRTLDEYPLDNTKVMLIYSGTTELKTSDGNTWAQEHIWPKSKGFSSETYVAYRDLHHLRPVNPSLNSSKNNHDVGNVLDFASVYKELAYGNKTASIEGGTIFEPRDAVKGDVARALFYMDVRYKGETQTDPNLTLVNEGLPTNSSLGDGYFGHLDTLLLWNEQDPVDDYERRRNDLAHNIQGNRNPFIDHPEYALKVYSDDFGDPDDPDYDKNRADYVSSFISSIGTVSLDSLNTILKAENMYYKLNDNQRALVSNYSVLVEARKTYDELYDAIKIFSEYSADFSDITGLSSGYGPNKTGTLENQDWYFSYSYKSGDTWLGSNNANPVLPEKFQSFYTSTYGASLEMQWDIENATFISFTFGNNYVTPTLDLFVSYDQGETYLKLDKVDNSLSKVSAYCTPGDDVRFALVLTGSAAARIHVDKVEILKHIDVSKIMTKIESLGTTDETQNHELINIIDKMILDLNNNEYNIPLSIIGNYDLFEIKKKLVQVNKYFNDNPVVNFDTAMEFYQFYSSFSIRDKENFLQDPDLNILILNALELYYDTKYLEVIEQSSTLSSIMFSFEENENTYRLIDNSPAIRFGSYLDKALYDKIKEVDINAEFGIRINNDIFISTEPALVSHIGAANATTEGYFYQFAVVLKDIPFEDLDVVNTYTVYVKINNEYYYMQEATHSFVSVAKAYLDMNLIELNEYKEILEYIYEEYKNK